MARRNRRVVITGQMEAAQGSGTLEDSEDDASQPSRRFRAAGVV